MDEHKTEESVFWEEEETGPWTVEDDSTMAYTAGGTLLGRDGGGV